MTRSEMMTRSHPTQAAPKEAGHFRQHQRFSWDFSRETFCGTKKAFFQTMGVGVMVFLRRGAWG